MGPLVYLLCFAASLMCTALLFKSYFSSRNRLLLWTGLCFTGFALNNLLLVIDLLVFPQFDLIVVRALMALVGLLILIYGLIEDATL